jgi:hypothetical protein
VTQPDVARQRANFGASLAIRSAVHLRTGHICAIQQEKPDRAHSK